MTLNPPANAEDTRDAVQIPKSGRSPSQKDLLEQEMATCYSILAMKIP